MQAVSPENDEAERLASLHAYEILDTGPEPQFDAIVRLASHAFKVPTAAISFIDQDRQWVKSSSGMFAAGNAHSREVALCNFAIQAPDEIFVVEDASREPRFSSNPLVTQLGGIRFYAGVPLLDPDGRALGTLCVIDQVARQICLIIEPSLARRVSAAG